jgi:hypothetical protein
VKRQNTQSPTKENTQSPTEKKKTHNSQMNGKTHNTQIERKTHTEKGNTHTQDSTLSNWTGEIQNDFYALTLDLKIS